MRIFKTIIYHLLLSLRGIFFFLFNLLRILPIIGFIGGAFHYFTTSPNNKDLGIMIVAVGMFIGIYFLKHFYDKIIFWAKPEDVELTLFK